MFKRFIKILSRFFVRTVIVEPPPVKTRFEEWKAAVAQLADNKTPWVFIQPGNDWENNEERIAKLTELEQAKQDLKIAIADEDYLEAARLRDKINSFSSTS